MLSCYSASSWCWHCCFGDGIYRTRLGGMRATSRKVFLPFVYTNLCFELCPIPYSGTQLLLFSWWFLEFCIFNDYLCLGTINSIMQHFQHWEGVDKGDRVDGLSNLSSQMPFQSYSEYNEIAPINSQWGFASPHLVRVFSFWAVKFNNTDFQPPITKGGVFLGLSSMDMIW